MKILLIIVGILIYLFLGILALAILYKLDGTVYLYENDINWADFFGVVFWPMVLPMVLLCLGFNSGYVRAINFLLSLFNKEDYKNDERNND